MTHELIEHLRQDHEKQRSLGEQLKKADRPKERDELRQQYHDEVYPHMRGEENSIFPFMKNAGDGEARDEAMEALQEHHIAKLVLRELADLKLESEVFKAKASVLDELNRHHIDEEESTHFAWLEGHASNEELDELFRRYEEAEEDAKKG